MSQHYSTCNRCRAVRNEKNLVHVGGFVYEIHKIKHTGWVCRSEAQCDRIKNWQPRSQLTGPTVAERLAQKWTA